MAPFLLAIFLSAFLLFQLQPIIARFILPSYGGSPAVWTACMMFFQVALLFGYLYAHLLANFVPVKRQPILHLSLLALSLILLPVGTPDSWTPTTGRLPAIEIIALLSISVGIPFVLISASGPLLQHWFAGAFTGRSPFRLYAVSNIGSLVALLTYPILFEPVFTIDMQATMWSFGYLMLIPVCILCGIAFSRNSGDHQTRDSVTPDAQPVTMTDRILWVALAACGSTLLLAMTNYICQNVAVVPFLWIVPLSLYLLTFIICFDRDAWYRRRIWLSLLFVSLALMLEVLFQQFTPEPVALIYELGICCLALFTCCMVCHGELVRRRSAVRHLTTFYLYVALGGALGGVFVNLVAPIIFTGFWELHIGLVATVLLAGICIGMDNQRIDSGLRRVGISATFVMFAGALSIVLIMQIQGGRTESIHIARSFFGVMYVDESQAGTYRHERDFYHGAIQHGKQLMHPAYQRIPTTYYGAKSGVYAAIRHHPRRKAKNVSERGLSIGLVGLGVGTLSALGAEQDSFRYYEINPQVEQIARKYFTFLRLGKAKTEVVLGDARISMQHELIESGSNEFDVLILDAFSGDAIPVHLLTAEAFDLYMKHLREDGILAVHISNQFIELRPVIQAAAERMGKDAILVESENERWYENGSDWVLMSSNRDFLNSPKIGSIQTPWPDEGPSRIEWTDDFSNVIQLIDWRN
jgi:spermidine synthase